MEQKITAALGALFLLVGSFTSGGEAPEITIEAATAEQTDLARWALGRFEAAGLDLPPLVISFEGDDFSDCEGAAARAYTSQTPVVVRVCWVDPFILLHELGHVWADANLSEADRESFMAMRQDARSWSGSDVSWAQRGNEHAANVIAWGLVEDPFLVSRTYPNDPQSMVAGFEHLTGRAPLHDGGDGVLLIDRTEFQQVETRPIESGR